MVTGSLRENAHNAYLAFRSLCQGGNLDRTTEAEFLDGRDVYLTGDYQHTEVRLYPALNLDDAKQERHAPAMSAPILIAYYAPEEKAQDLTARMAGMHAIVSYGIRRC